MAGGPQVQAPLRLLSLDGGGIRGISELVILEEIMHRVGRAKKLDYDPPPADYFDLICGTSTGGLIAILVGRLGCSVAEAIDKYRVLAKEVFSEKKVKGKDGRFKASKLEQAIKRVVEEKLGVGHADEKMWATNINGQLCKTFVCAVPSAHIDHKPRLFRTWPADKNPGSNCAIWEACLATTAAPTFFKRVLIGPPGLQEEFVDAGLGCNNPTQQLLQEAQREFPGRDVACILSIGTGLPKVAALKSSKGLFERFIPFSVIEALKSIASSSEHVADEMKQRFRNCPELYYRMNVDRGLENVSLEEWEQLGNVKTHTLAYLHGPDISAKIDQIVDALTGKSTQSYRLEQLDGAVAYSYDFLVPIRNDYSHVEENSAIKQSEDSTTLGLPVSQRPERRLLYQIAKLRQQLISQNLPTQDPDGKPVILNDARGRRFPFYPGFIGSAERFVELLKDNFQDFGSRKIERGEWSLQDHHTGRILDLRKPWQSLFRVHTWGADAEEVTFNDLTKSNGKNKPGYKKIQFCGERAAKDGLKYFWIDTCCIDKANSVELQEAINPMYWWYPDATRCYVYLGNVSSPRVDIDNENAPIQLPCEAHFRASKWFTRGWTLQELLAPQSGQFFSKEQIKLGNKRSLERPIHEITRIAIRALKGCTLSASRNDLDGHCLVRQLARRTGLTQA